MVELMLLKIPPIWGPSNRKTTITTTAIKPELERIQSNLDLFLGCELHIMPPQKFDILIIDKSKSNTIIIYED
jgi:hypothetical protein